MRYLWGVGRFVARAGFIRQPRDATRKSQIANRKSQISGGVGRFIGLARSCQLRVAHRKPPKQKPTKGRRGDMAQTGRREHLAAVGVAGGVHRAGLLHHQGLAGKAAGDKRVHPGLTGTQEGILRGGLSSHGFGLFDIAIAPTMALCCLQLPFTFAVWLSLRLFLCGCGFGCVAGLVGQHCCNCDARMIVIQHACLRLWPELLLLFATASCDWRACDWGWLRGTLR